MRLWITGIGLVTPLGLGTEATWSRLVRGECALRPIARFATDGYRASVGAEVSEVGAPEDPTSSRAAEMARLAAREAMGDARIDLKGERVGLVVGGTTGGMLENEEILARVSADASKKRDLDGLLAHPLWATTDLLDRSLGPFARVRALSSACSSGANALVVAAAWLLAGDMDAVVAGGADGICRLTLAGFNALATIDPGGCRPFDARRRGLSLGEGAGFVVLERDDRARARGRAPIAELAGWSLGAEAHHITNPEPTGAMASRVIERALARARLTARDVDYVNAHGTGTPLNDPMEAAAIARALGPAESERVFVSSSKGQIGHTLGAAGAIEAAISALVVSRRTLVPTGGLEEVDEACRALRHVMGAGRTVGRVRAVVSNAFGFGGMDSALVLTEPELAPPHEQARRALVITGAATLTPAGLFGTRDGARALDAARGDQLPAIEPHLDLDRARRLDRPARLGAVVALRALADAGTVDRDRTGVVLGTVFGSIDATAAFIRRILSKGARFASPAEFPNLVPSSPVGHASIYLGLRGPVLAAAELGASGECAAMLAAELVGAGEADAIVAGDVDEGDGIVDRVFAALFAHDAGEASVKRREGAAAVVIEAEDAARARGADLHARLIAVAAWREGGVAPELPAPRDGARAVVLACAAHGVDELLARSPWEHVARITCASSGAIAIAAATSRIARGEASDALVVGLATGRGYAVVLGAP